MFNKLKELKDLRDQSKKMKDMLDAITIIGSGKGGKVLVTLNGSHEVLGVQLADGMTTDDIAAGLRDAMNDANKKLQMEMVKNMKDMGGLGGLGDMMKNMGNS